MSMSPESQPVHSSTEHLLRTTSLMYRLYLTSLGNNLSRWQEVRNLDKGSTRLSERKSIEKWRPKNSQDIPLIPGYVILAVINGEHAGMSDLFIASDVAGQISILKSASNKKTEHSISYFQRVVEQKFGESSQNVSVQNALFQNELKVMNLLNQQNVPHVPQVKLLTSKNGREYLAMEFLDPVTYVQTEDLVKLGHFPAKAALIMAASIGQIIDDFAEHGVYHCDLKPNNIFTNFEALLTVLKQLDLDGLRAALTLSQEIQMHTVVDFGLAYAESLREHPSDTEKINNTVIDHCEGTISYNSPQRLRSITQGGYDALSPEEKYQGEIFVLGLMLYRFVMGKDIYDHDNAEKYMDTHFLAEKLSGLASQIVEQLLPEAEDDAKQMAKSTLFFTLSKGMGLVERENFTSAQEFIHKLIKDVCLLEISPVPTRPVPLYIPVGDAHQDSLATDLIRDTQRRSESSIHTAQTRVIAPIRHDHTTLLLPKWQRGDSSTQLISGQ